jgi:ribosomal protein S18 acetylase RimI-like enzyme
MPGQAALSAVRPTGIMLPAMNNPMVRVSYLELTQAPAPIPGHPGKERISRERLPVAKYLDLYQRVGERFRWDQRLRMPRAELSGLLESDRSRIYVLRDEHDRALGLCEFERCPPETELKNFGLVHAAQGRRLGSWLLRTALHQEWRSQPRRIWLHTDDWDHPAALHLYRAAGFRIYQIRDEPPANL